MPEPDFFKVSSSDQVPVGFAVVTMKCGKAFFANMTWAMTMLGRDDVEAVVLHPAEYTSLKAYCDEMKKKIQ